jgi:hypothetical protein
MAGRASRSFSHGFGGVNAQPDVSMTIMKATVALVMAAGILELPGRFIPGPP